VFVTKRITPRWWTEVLPTEVSDRMRFSPSGPARESEGIRVQRGIEPVWCDDAPAGTAGYRGTPSANKKIASTGPSAEAKNRLRSDRSGSYHVGCGNGVLPRETCDGATNGFGNTGVAGGASAVIGPYADQVRDESDDALTTFVYRQCR